MSTFQLEQQCSKCGRSFWTTAAERVESSAPPNRCPDCRSKRNRERTKTQSIARPKADTRATHLIGPRQMMVEDLRELLETTFGPIDPHPRTLLEWWDALTGDDNVILTKRLDEKHRACDQANKLVQQRTGLMQNLKGMVLATGELEDVEIERERKRRRDQVEDLKLETEELRLKAERFRLEEEIAQQQALKEGRLKTQQLEEARKQTRILVELEPPPPPEPPEDPAQKTIAEYRSQAQTMATAKQLGISDFLNDVHQIYEANLDGNEKVLRIRAVLDGYRQDFEALPRKIRGFVERVENDEPESQEDLAKKNDEQFVATVNDFYSDTMDRTQKAMLIRKLMGLYKRGTDALTPEVRKLVEDSEEEFRRTAVRICSSDRPDGEKLLGIRALLNTYCHHAGALPEEVREFVKRAEKQRGAA